MALMAASQLEGDQSRVVGSGRLPAGKSVLSYQFVSDGGVNAGGEMRISVDGREIGRGRIARTISKLPEMTDTLDIALQVADEVGMPLMCHIDEPPPSYEDVVNKLRPGDVLTHAFRPFPNAPCTAQGTVRPAVLAARKRGVLFVASADQRMALHVPPGHRQEPGRRDVAAV